MKNPHTEKYIYLPVIISLVVAFLTHFPELISLTEQPGGYDLFPGINATEVISEMLFTFFSLLFLFAVNTLLFRYDRTTSEISPYKLFLSFIIMLVLSNLLGQGFVYVHDKLRLPAIDTVIHHYLHPIRDFIIAFIVTGSCYMVHIIRKSRQVQIENQLLQAENLISRNEALKNQLNPHMLFNSLNTLRSLIREMPDKAQEYLQELSRVLRYTLKESGNVHVHLKEEIEFVHAYIFLLKMRYEENLIFDIQIDKELENRLVPPMSIQLLVENAVNHNEISNRRPLTVQIYTEGEALTVKNPLHPKRTSTTGTCIGLANLSKRYQLTFRKEIRIENDDNHFTVTIPLI